MMQSAKKVTLVPPEQIGGSNEIEIPSEGSYEKQIEKPEKFDRIKNKIYDKIHRFIKVILKLAKTDFYDEGLRIKSRDGKYLEKTNIVDLLTHAMSAGKVLHGEDDFIVLLARSGIDPDLILNENVKSKLLRLKTHNFQSRTTEPIVNEIKKFPDYQPDKPKETKKGNKKYIIVNDDGEQELVLDAPSTSLKRKITSNEDQDTNENELKRKRLDEDDDSIDDELIDSTRWKV